MLLKFISASVFIYSAFASQAAEVSRGVLPDVLLVADRDYDGIITESEFNVQLEKEKAASRAHLRPEWDRRLKILGQPSIDKYTMREFNLWMLDLMLAADGNKDGELYYEELSAYCFLNGLPDPDFPPFHTIRRKNTGWGTDISVFQDYYWETFEQAEQNVFLFEDLVEKDTLTATRMWIFHSGGDDEIRIID